MVIHNMSFPVISPKVCQDKCENPRMQARLVTRIASHSLSKEIPNCYTRTLEVKGPSLKTVHQFLDEQKIPYLKKKRRLGENILSLMVGLLGNFCYWEVM